MLPDFPLVKAQLERNLLLWALQQIPQIAPLLGEIRTFHQHEGKSGKLARVDESTDEIKYAPHQFGFTLTRDEMRRTDLPVLFAKLKELAERMAEAQETLMFARIGEAVEAVGNTVDAGGDFQPKHLFEMIEKMQMDFDPETGEPTGHILTMHPDTLKKVAPKIKEWEKDPAVTAEYERILAKKREEWRVREDRRKLVD